MSRIVLATAGSLGDLNPYIAVGLGLKARGHDVTIATVDFYRPNVEGEGLRFHAVRPDIAPATYRPEVFRSANNLRTGTQYLLKELVLPAVEQTYQDLTDACHGADLMVIHPVLFPAPVVAEKLGLKWISVALAPGTFVSAYDPPVLPPFPWLRGLRHLGPLPNALIFRLFGHVTRGWMKPIDELRQRAGLPPARKHPIHEGMFSPLGTLAWFSTALASPQPDWPVGSRITGFPFYDNSGVGRGLETSLAEFLDSGEPPVVFTLGSSAVLDAGDFFEQSLEATRRIGCRAVFLVGADPRNRLQSPLPKTVFVAGQAPYSELFPKSAAVVHQGGIGTTAEALRAGVPMLVVPFMHDQPDNAFRVSRLGVARVVSRASYNADRAAANLRVLLDRQDYTARAKGLAERIQQEDGVASACAALEQHAAGA